MFRFPQVVYLGEGQVEFLGHVGISEPVQGFLCLGVGGVCADRDAVPAGHPGLFTVAHEFADVPAAVGPLPALPWGRSLFFAAKGAENGIILDLCSAFTTLHLTFLSGYATIKG